MSWRADFEFRGGAPGRKRRRVSSLDHGVLHLVDGLALLLREVPPQQEHDPFPLAAEPLDHRVCEVLPSKLRMRIRSRTLHRHRGIQKEDPLLRPGLQVSMGRADEARDILLELLPGA